MTEVNATALAGIAQSLLAAKMVSLSACITLFYDIAITIGDEVEHIWLKPKYTRMTILWALNRYITPLGFIVIMVSFHEPWSKSVCDRYVLFPEALKLVNSFGVGLVFIIRLFAIYNQSRAMLLFGSFLLAAELGTKIWAFTDGTRLDLPDGFVGCILVGRTSSRFVFSWIAELFFDSAMFILTLWRTIAYNNALNNGSTKSLMRLIQRDGIAYYATISIINLVTVVIFLFASANLKSISAGFSVSIMSIMVSRLILNLRNSVGYGGFHDTPRRIDDVELYTMPDSQVDARTLSTLSRLHAS